MKFTGNEDHSITLQEAAKQTESYRNSVPEGSILGGYFGKSTLQDILNQEGCVGIRCYYGLGNDDTPHFVLVGTDADGRDLVDGILASPCPPIYDDKSPLVR